MSRAKSFSISKQEVYDAYRQVKSNKGAAGVDNQTIKKFEEKLEDNLYKIWNRMSSGSYFPAPVKRAEIPKEGGTRPLGIPTVEDRIAQAVVKNRLEPEMDKRFHSDSYGYRPGKSAVEAVGVARERCWRYSWVLDMDIRAFFDNIDHELLMKALRWHTDNRWILLYVERWLAKPRGRFSRFTRKVWEASGYEKVNSGTAVVFFFCSGVFFVMDSLDTPCLCRGDGSGFNQTVHVSRGIRPYGGRDYC